MLRPKISSVESNDRPWLAKFGTRFIYKTFGPTTIHLDHEICLLVTAICLTSASLVSLYKLTIGSSALDFYYLMLTTLWLSRHLFHRLVCTTDVGTSLSGWTHHLRWMWIIMTSGGQYFDIPTSVFASTSYQLIADNSYAGSRNSGDVSSSIPLTVSPFAFHRIRIVQGTIISFLAAIWACWLMIKTKISLRSSNTFDFEDEDWSSTTVNSSNKRSKNSSNSGSDQLKKVGKSASSFAQSHKKCRKKLNNKLDRWWRYVPRAQFLVLVISVFGIVWFFQKYNEALSSYSLPLRSPRSPLFDKNMANPRMANAESMQQARDLPPHNIEYLNRRLESIHDGRHSAALWSRKFVYGPFGILCMIMSWGTICSILFFGRIMLPLPDLVSGSSGVVGRGSYKSSRPCDNDKAWSEKYHSIANENRVRLHFKIAALRIFEYFVLCAVLPRTEFICKATGHCDIEPMIHESGNPTLAGMTGESMYNQLIRDRWQEALITCTVILTTALLLISQVIVLDKSYLALKSYSNQEANATKKSGNGSRRKLVGNPESSAFDFPSNHGSGQSRGILGTIYNLVEIGKRSCVELFSNELGALSTSRVLSLVANVHVTYTLIVVVIWLYYAISGANWCSFFLIYLSLFSSAVEVGYLEPNVLDKIASEINEKYKKPAGYKKSK